MKNINVDEDIYATDFGNSLKAIINDLMNSNFERNKNTGAPFSFSENQLRKHFSRFSEDINSRTSIPKMVIERKIKGDFQSSSKKHGGTDYFYVKNLSNSYVHTDILATFEVKGPTRSSLLMGSRVNWYPKIIRDLEKQSWRNINFHGSLNYIVLLIKPYKNMDAHNQVQSLLRLMESEVKGIHLLECYWESILVRSAILNILIARVITI